MKRLSVVMLSLACIALTLPLQAAAPKDESADVKMILGQPTVLPANNPSRIAIGNPAVADVTSVTKSEITISPKAAGRTTLVFWDNFGEQSFQLAVYSEDIDLLKQRIDKLLSNLKLANVTTQIEEDSGKIILLGAVKTAAEKGRIDTILGDLKAKTIDLVELQEDQTVIEIDVQVFEIDRGEEQNLGFSWPNSVTLTDPSAMPAIDTVAGETWGRIFRVPRVFRDPFSVTIDALEQQGKAKILSRPRLACLNGKEAELLVGGEKPIFTTQTVSGGGSGTQVEYKEYGIKLSIRPTLGPDERIKIGLKVEVSELETTTPEFIGSANATTAKAYPLKKRNASTELYLNNGETMAIGGLMKQKTVEDTKSFPGLSKVPLLGWFARNKDVVKGGGMTEKGDNELFITLTPRIVPSVKEEPPAAKPLPAPPKPKAPEAVSNDPLTKYAQVIQQRVLGNLVYPPAAKNAGFQGTTLLGVHLSYLGKLLEVEVKESSGYKMLDNAAVAAAQRIQSFPPFPSSIEEKDLWVEIPIAYKLEE